MIIKQDEDSIFITADTLFSARLTDLYYAKKRDSVILDSIRAIQAAALKQRDSVIADSVKRVKAITMNQKDSIIADSIKGNKVAEMNKQDSVITDSTKGNKVAAMNQKDYIIPDSIKGVQVITMDEKDSTNRYFEAYRHVRIFSDSCRLFPIVCSIHLKTPFFVYSRTPWSGPTKAR